MLKPEASETTFGGGEIGGAFNGSIFLTRAFVWKDFICASLSCAVPVNSLAEGVGVAKVDCPPELEPPPPDFLELEEDEEEEEEEEEDFVGALKVGVVCVPPNDFGIERGETLTGVGVGLGLGLNLDVSLLQNPI